jgi:hypothetical protein
MFHICRYYNVANRAYFYTIVEETGPDSWKYSVNGSDIAVIWKSHPNYLTTLPSCVVDTPLSDWNIPIASFNTFEEARSVTEQSHPELFI